MAWFDRTSLPNGIMLALTIAYATIAGPVIVFATGVD
jgi:hypothetical protein